ncbi:unnamed protein product [Rhizopus stolonifer]
MNSNDISSWLALAGIITTANALWVPEKRAITFQNADSSKQNSQESSSSTSKKTTHSEKKTTTKKETTTQTTQSSAKTTHATSAASTTTTKKKSNSSSQSTPTTLSDITPSTASGTASSATFSSSSSNFDSFSSSSAVPTASSIMSNTAVAKSITSSSALSSSSVAAESASSSSSSSTGAIAGGVVAVVAVATIGSAALLFVRRKRRRELKQSRAARMSTRADPYTEGYGGSEPKPYTDYQNMPPAPQPAYNEANNVPMAAAAATATAASYGTYEPALVPDNHSKEMIEQQQQQYYQSQTSVVEPSLSPMIPPVVVSPSGPQETSQTPSLGTFTVIATYIPTLSDELEIEPGDRIELLVEYDDGWCQGINVTRNYAKGVFPRHCIDYETALSEHSSNADIERTKRVSSMYVTGLN